MVVVERRNTKCTERDGDRTYAAGRDEKGKRVGIRSKERRWGGGVKIRCGGGGGGES